MSKEKRKLKIAWVADFTVKTYKAGGAQYTNELIIREGRRQGYQIDVITPKDKVEKGYDLYILHNVRYFSDSFLNDIIENKKYMRMEHDYWIVGTVQNNRRFMNILDKSLLNLFMSKKHLQVCSEKINRTIPKSDYVTSPIDTNVFFIDKKIKKDRNLVAWTGHDKPENKGFVENVLPYTKKNPHLSFKMFGIFKEYNNSNTPDNMEIIGEVEQEVFAKCLKKAQYLMATPVWIEPSGRSVAEGMLCGCDLIVNDNIGFLYEDTNWNDYEALKTKVHTENKFWKLVEGVI